LWRATSSLTATAVGDNNQTIPYLVDIMQAPQQQYAQPAAQPQYAQQAAAPVAAAPVTLAPVAVAPAAGQMVVNVPTGKGNYKWLASGETVITEVTGQLGFTSPNPLTRMLVGIMKVVAAICGSREKASLVVTNNRVVIDVRKISFYILETGCDTITINKCSTITTGFNSSLLIFKKRYIAVDGNLVGVKSGASQQDLEAMSVVLQGVL